jgi:hypothetical protein
MWYVPNLGDTKDRLITYRLCSELMVKVGSQALLSVAGHHRGFNLLERKVIPVDIAIKPVRLYKKMVIEVTDVTVVTDVTDAGLREIP